MKSLEEKAALALLYPISLTVNLARESGSVACSCLQAWSTCRCWLEHDLFGGHRADHMLEVIALHGRIQLTDSIQSVSCQGRRFSYQGLAYSDSSWRKGLDFDTKAQHSLAMKQDIVITGIPFSPTSSGERYICSLSHNIDDMSVQQIRRLCARTSIKADLAERGSPCHS